MSASPGSDQVAAQQDFVASCQEETSRGMDGPACPGPNLPIVAKLHQEGIEVKDWSAIDRAVAELWKAVDKGTLRSMAIGGRPRRVVRLDAQFTRGVPALRT